jgi:hypothetical protein
MHFKSLKLIGKLCANLLNEETNPQINYKIPKNERARKFQGINKSKQKKGKIMIDKYYYNLLPIEEKAYLLCSKGELITIVATSNFDLSLYTLDGEYVELFYSIAFNKIDDIKIIEDPLRLDIYTRNLDISDLLA